MEDVAFVRKKRKKDSHKPCQPITGDIVYMEDEDACDIDDIVDKCGQNAKDQVGDQFFCPFSVGWCVFWAVSFHGEILVEVEKRTFLGGEYPKQR